MPRGVRTDVKPFSINQAKLTSDFKKRHPCGHTPFDSFDWGFEAGTAPALPLWHNRIRIINQYIKE